MVYAKVHMCVGYPCPWKHNVEARGWWLVSCSISLPRHFLRQGLSPNLKLAVSLGLASHWASQGLPVFFLLHACATDVHHHTWIFLHAEDPNLSPHACTKSALPTKPFPQHLTRDSFKMLLTGESAVAALLSGHVVKLAFRYLSLNP